MKYLKEKLTLQDLLDLRELALTRLTYNNYGPDGVDYGWVGMLLEYAVQCLTSEIESTHPNHFQHPTINLRQELQNELNFDPTASKNQPEA